MVTEQGKTSTVVEETRKAVDITLQPAVTERKSRNSIVLILNAVAIAIAPTTGVSLHGWSKQQTVNQTTTSDALVNQLTALQKAQESQGTELEGITEQQAVQFRQANRQREALAKQLDGAQQKAATISSSDTKTRLLAQADFLVKFAGWKSWSDQDVTTTVALLKSTDVSLADMNDPSLITARWITIDDIASLSVVSQANYDGIILKLSQLSNQVDNLRLVGNDSDGSPMNSDGEELSSFISEQHINLRKSWQNFMGSFVTIHRRDDIAVPLLVPSQDIYPCENIRSRLLIAVQVIPCHQEETYRRALENVSTWMRAYYDTGDATTKAFLSEVSQLNQQNISMDPPETPQSQAMLKKPMQTRVCNLLTQPAAGTTEAKPVPAPAPAPAPTPAPQAGALAATPQGE